MKISKLIETNFIHRLGRTYLKNEELHMNFSGSGIRLLCDSDYLNLKFKARFKDINSAPYIALIVDGNINYIAIDEETKSIKLPLKSALHQIDVIKNTESPVSQIALLEVEADSFLKYNHQKKLKLEFYGDSITCGYGVLDDVETNPFTSKTESFVDSYAYIASRLLDSDYSSISVSGFPVYKSRWNLGFPIDSVADMISICDYEEPMTSDTSTLWDNSNYIPDVVVINLGANDESYFTVGTDWVDELVSEVGSFEKAIYTKKYQDELDKMEEKIFAFLDNIFRIYGDIKVVYATGILPIIDIVDSKITEAILKYQKERNHKVYRYQFKVRNHFNQRGANYHPGKQMQVFSGCELANYIFDILGD